MPTIHRLSAHDAQKIAAGQVIERPADILKELVENAIDAHATQITVYLEEAGKKLIRVVDNGCGMDSADAQLCFEKHATSKLHTIDQLESISTFGFRGEAMPSIAAVCKVTLITRTADTQEGVKVCVEKNVITSTEPVCASIGTDITATDLFYTMPARQKFLKKTETEWRHLLQLMQAFCLDYPAIQFKLISDGKQALYCPPVTHILARCAQLWDHTIAAHMLAVQATKESGTMSISGAIGDHQQFRFDRNHIFIFINNRWVKNFKLTNAVIKGYMNVAPPARYPIACIALTLDPSLVDINIHPRKEEVSFVHPVVVENFIKDTVKARLEENIASYIKSATLRSSFAKASDFVKTSSDKSEDKHEGYDRLALQAPSYVPFNFEVTELSPTTTSADFAAQQTPLSASPEPVEGWRDKQQIPLSSRSAPVLRLVRRSLGEVGIFNEGRNVLRSFSEEEKIIGQYHNTYLLIEQENGLCLIDQHAAHERILYEKFGARFEQMETVSLLFAQLIPLSAHDIATLEPHMALLQQFGIQVELFGANQLRVTALPIALKDINVRELLEQAIGWIHENSGLEAELIRTCIHEKMRAQMACKAAVKAGDILTEQQMNQLLRDLHNTDNRMTCPHGRPTTWLISLHEIEKKFKRKT